MNIHEIVTCTTFLPTINALFNINCLIYSTFRLGNTVFCESLLHHFICFSAAARPFWNRGEHFFHACRSLYCNSTSNTARWRWTDLILCYLVRNCLRIILQASPNSQVCKRIHLNDWLNQWSFSMCNGTNHNRSPISDVSVQSNFCGVSFIMFPKWLIHRFENGSDKLSKMLPYFLYT